jgi:hypothetical protein
LLPFTRGYRKQVPLSLFTGNIRSPVPLRLMMVQSELE